MQSWEKKLEGETFQELFQTGFAAPVDISTSRSMKGLTDREIYESGPSLSTLGTLNVDQLTLSRSCDHSWAMEQLSIYGPKPTTSWQADNVVFGIPPEIADEDQVGQFLEEAFLGRAICGGFCLFSLATGLVTAPCPGPESCNLINNSSSGSSGRPDRVVRRGGKACCLLENKTKRVCGMQGDALGDLRSVDLIYKGSMWVPGESDKLLGEGFKKKATTIVYQVSQLSSVSVSH
jgi:hypothetical protein